MSTTMFYGAPAPIFENAKRLRGEMTEPEQILWSRLSRNQLGCRFRRQHAIGNFIADFYCHRAKLVIEIDGRHHRNGHQAINDSIRTRELELHGIRVLRFTNKQVKHGIDNVVEEIQSYLI